MDLCKSEANAVCIVSSRPARVIVRRCLEKRQPQFHPVPLVVQVAALTSGTSWKRRAPALASFLAPWAKKRSWGLPARFAGPKKSLPASGSRDVLAGASPGQGALATSAWLSRLGGEGVAPSHLQPLFFAHVTHLVSPTSWTLVFRLLVFVLFNPSLCLYHPL